jgi:hypothetical protein
MKSPLTRKELYELVWSKPMVKVAEEFELSDVALHKICKKHRIPKPGLGYWAKVAAGKPVKRTPLFDISGEALGVIDIRGGFWSCLPEEVKIAHKKIKEKPKQKNNDAPPDAAPKALHFYAQLLKQKLETNKTDSTKIRIEGPKFFSISTDTIDGERLIAIVDMLACEAERKGFLVIPGDNSLHLMIDGEAISLSISEKTKNVPHRLTEKEAKDLQKWEADCERDRRATKLTFSWLPKPQIPATDAVPNGQLLVEIDRGSHWDGLHRKFSDGENRRIEKKIPAIMTAAAMCAVSAKARRVEAADRAEKVRLAEIEHRRLKLEEKRTEAFNAKMQFWAKARDMRRFADDMETVLQAAENSDNSQTVEWIQWVRSAADGIDPLRARLPRLLQEADFNPWNLR